MISKEKPAITWWQITHAIAGSAVQNFDLSCSKTYSSIIGSIFGMIN